MSPISNGVAALVPGLQLTEIEPGYDIGVARGISTGIQSVGPTVATYFDDTPTTSASLSGLGHFLTPDPDLFDMQRIEVFEGPQGAFRRRSEGLSFPLRFNRARTSRSSGARPNRGDPGHRQDSGHLVLNLPLIKGVLAIRLDGFRIENPDSSTMFTAMRLTQHLGIGRRASRDSLDALRSFPGAPDFLLPGPHG